MYRPATAPVLVLLAALVALVPGCTSRVDFAKTVSLEGGDIKSYTIDAPRGEQKVRVSIDSSEPIDVDVALASNAADVQKALDLTKRPDAARLLASKQGVKTDTVEATVPAGKEFTILLSGARKKTEVKLKVNSI